MISFALFVLCTVHLTGLPQVHSYTYQECPKWWVKKGCRVDYHRGLEDLFDDRKPNATVKIDWDNFDAYAYDLACRCRTAADNKGYKFFALGRYGICFSASGSMAEFLNAYPMDTEENCIGVLKHNKTIVSQIDGEICVGGYSRVFFYEITNNGAAAPAAAPQEEEEEEEVKCRMTSDVVLVVDTSSSIGIPNFKLLLQFLLKFLERYDFSAGKSRLAVITFDEHCYVDLTWKDSSIMTVDGIRKVIENLKYTAGSTLTDNALNCTREKIIPSQRPGVPKTVVVLTDGEGWGGKNAILVPSQLLRDLGCKMLAIGIGNDVNPEELEAITGKPNQMFLLNSFRALVDHAAKTLNDLLGKACV